MRGEILMPDTRRIIDLDKINQRILQMLIDNSRTSISEISKSIKISKPAVLQRIRKMEQKGIILQYIAYYNLIKAGYKFHIVLLETDKENELDYSEQLSNCDFNAAVVLLAAKFNICWMVYSKDTEHFNALMREATSKIKIKDIKICPVIDNYFDTYQLFDSTKSSSIHKSSILKKTKKVRDKKQSFSPVKLDKQDAQILKSLKNNSRISLVEISQQCSLTAEAIKKRISQLDAKGIILSKFTNFNIFKLGFQPYIILIKTNRQNQKEMMNFIRKHKNTNGQYLLDSEYDIMSSIVVKNVYELREFIHQLYSLFNDSILSYESYLVIDQISNDFLPKGVYKDIVKE